MPASSAREQAASAARPCHAAQGKTVAWGGPRPVPRPPLLTVGVRFIAARFARPQSLLSRDSRPFALAILLYGIAIHASACVAKPVSLQVETGGVLATLSREFDPPDYNFPLLLGAQGGMGIRIALNERFSANFGFNYEQRGAKADGSFPSVDEAGNEGRGTYVATERLDYFCMPITLEASLQRRSLTPFIRAGSEIGFLVSGERHSVLTAGGHRLVEDEQIDARMKDTDIGFLMGLGVIWSQSIPVYLELRYLHGLTSITESSYKQRNRAIIAALGVQI